MANEIFAMETKATEAYIEYIKESTGTTHEAELS
jgi:hypothetical protein